MGCDIHGHVELVTELNSLITHEDGRKQRDKTVYVIREDSPSLDRDYWLFALMADVQNDRGLEPVATPRGLPDDVSFDVQDKTILIVHNELAEKFPNYITEEEARRYGGPIYTEGSLQYIMHPDYHSHSWLTVKELEEVQRRYAALASYGQPVGRHKTLDAIIAMMKVFQRPEKHVIHLPGLLTKVTRVRTRARYVFWFGFDK